MSWTTSIGETDPNEMFAIRVYLNGRLQTTLAVCVRSALILNKLSPLQDDLNAHKQTGLGRGAPRPEVAVIDEKHPEFRVAFHRLVTSLSAEATTKLKNSAVAIT